MAKKKIFWVVLVIALVFGFASCGDDDDGDSGNSGGGGGIPAALVGTWSGGGSTALVINSDGSGSYAEQPGNWTVSGSTLTLTIGVTTGSVTWQVNGNQLTLTSGEGSLGPTLATLSPYTKQ
jgi:hypothetical protein